MNKDGLKFLFFFKLIIMDTGNIYDNVKQQDIL